MLYDQIQEAVRFIRSRSGFQPRFGIILGTGLSGLAVFLIALLTISYQAIKAALVNPAEVMGGEG